jgi:hypothetical protein
MTFKHVKFEDSPTMRALEKVAREKGLVKPEPLTKKASVVKKADLTPSDNLMENILKLCNGLREKGMVKDASELETKYLQYKQAQTLYEAHKETGEDLLEEAHPEGSHKLVDVDSAEAVVEDLLDKHDLIEEVAEKEPKAKLSDAASVIGAVKNVLGQFARPAPGQTGQSGTPQAPKKPAQAEMDQAAKDVNSALTMAQKGGGLTGIVMSQSWGRYNVVKAAADNPDLNPDAINDAISAINALQRWLHPNFLHNYMPEFLNKGVSTDALWTVISQKLDSAEAHCNKAVQLVAQEMGKSSSISKRLEQLLSLAQEGPVDPEATKKGKEAMVQALQLIDRGLGALLNVFYGPLLEEKKPDIDAARKQLNDLIGKLNATGDGDVPNQLMQDIGSQIYGVRQELDKMRNSYSSGDNKVDDPAWWRKFNMAASLIGQGQSMSWGATKAINSGDLSGLQFHASHISSDEAMNAIVINLVRPLTQVKSEMSSINVDQIKNPRLKQVFPQLVQDLEAAVTSAQSAANGVVSAGDGNLRVIHPSKLAGLFGPPLDKDNKGAAIFSGVTSIDTLKAKCNYVVGIYKGYLNTIKKAVG